MPSSPSEPPRHPGSSQPSSSLHPCGHNPRSSLLTPFSSSSKPLKSSSKLSRRLATTVPQVRLLWPVFPQREHLRAFLGRLRSACRSRSFWVASVPFVNLRLQEGQLCATSSSVAITASGARTILPWAFRALKQLPQDGHVTNLNFIMIHHFLWVLRLGGWVNEQRSKISQFTPFVKGNKAQNELFRY